MAEQTAIHPAEKTLFGHPIGLFILFFTEMWERFSYYGMRAILVLFVASSLSEGGMGWTKGEALELYGWYTMFVYVMAIPGGIIADKYWGQKKSVMVGALTLVAGHLILAVEQDWAFFTGLTLIVLGVGLLKPNISTMVGGLYAAGDIRRDKGFTIFYIGINIGAFAASITVGIVAAAYGWHAGFGLAGIGMVVGYLTFLWGQKFLKGVGEFTSATEGSEDQKAAKQRPLTSVEKDRVVVLLISFLIIIVFWGAFEQAGGFLNIYAKDKIDRVFDVFGTTLEMPTSWFQSFNALFIILLGTAVASFWANRKLKGKGASTLLKMGVGNIIMGLGFFLMVFASNEASEEVFGKASFWWLAGAYLLHTIGELCASPTALSFITKLAPLKYASIMMGIYFAATGFGNKLAGLIGESSQLKPYGIEWKGTFEEASQIHTADTALKPGSPFEAKVSIEVSESRLQVASLRNGQSLEQKLSFPEQSASSLGKQDLLQDVATFASGDPTPMHARIFFEQRESGEYKSAFVLEEMQSEKERTTFRNIFILAAVFGLLILLLLKKLNALTHGAEDDES